VLLTRMQVLGHAPGDALEMAVAARLAPEAESLGALLQKLDALEAGTGPAVRPVPGGVARGRARARAGGADSTPRVGRQSAGPPGLPPPRRIAARVPAAWPRRRPLTSRRAGRSPPPDDAELLCPRAATSPPAPRAPASLDKRNVLEARAPRPHPRVQQVIEALDASCARSGRTAQ
jgi:hypothetical protein